MAKQTPADELRDLSDAELVERHEELKQELFNLRFQMATGQLDNYRHLGNTKRAIARVRTLQREREILDAGGGQHSQAEA